MPCNNDLYCQNFINHTVCNNNKCECNYNYFSKTGFICGRPFNAQCLPDESCATDNSICIDYKCQCKKNYVFQDTKCVPSTYACWIIKFYELSRKKKLFDVFNNTIEHLNEPCETAADCDGIKFAECSEENKCRCKDKYFAINETHCSLKIGEYCSTNEECGVKNSNCWFNQCYCELGYINILNEECIPSK